MAKFLECSECKKIAFYYDDYVGTEKNQARITSVL
jgi:hypothetical protein